ncbi:MAG: glycosyltransferase family 2 protein [Bacilli bacterium]|nr:glycosyltransferase family 2 protein [Bacilli bacterium]
MKKKKISIIGQCYNEEETIILYYDAMCNLMKEMKNVDFEIIFIDDNSKDSSLNIIKKIAKKDERVKYISMSRNFGREACAMAGFENASGDYLTTMDIDLQDPPHLLKEMYKVLEEGEYDIASAKALTRKGYSFLHKICINTFYKMFNSVSTVKMYDGQREYRLMTRQVIESILKFKEYNLFNKGLLNDIGFKYKWIEYTNVERIKGTSKFPYKRMFKYAINGIVSYSTFPLVSLLILSGLFLLLFVISLIIYLFLQSTTLLCVTMFLFILSIIFLNNGIIGLYISQIHLEVKNRPIYIIKEDNLV